MTKLFSNGNILCHQDSDVAVIIIGIVKPIPNNSFNVDYSEGIIANTVPRLVAGSSQRAKNLMRYI